MAPTLRVLITVKTYPIPSESYQELVCTAGVLEDGRFVRLYPIDYRYRPYWEWYSKYQWIELEAEKNPKDPRPESYRPVAGAKIKTLGKPVQTTNNWALRRETVFKGGTQVMCDLERLPQTEKSLGLVRPREVSDFIIESTDRDWSPKGQMVFQQQRLFGPKQKPLEKIPYKFSYLFKCEDASCKGHKKMIEDWEVGELYRKMRDKYGEEVATQKVRDRFYTNICGADKDTHFFVGTVLQHGSWIVLGAFWPKKTQR